MQSSNRPRRGVFLTAIALSVLILLVDLQIPLGVAGGVPYVAVVLLALWLPGRRYILFFSSLCILFTMLGFFLSPGGGENWQILSNRLLAAGAILVTTGLCLQRKGGEKELHDVLRRLESIIEFLPDATFVIDAQGRVLAWNRAMEELTGVGKQQILGRGDHAYAAALFGAKGPVLIDWAMRADEPGLHVPELLKRDGDTLVSERCLLRHDTGRRAYLWMRAAPIRERDGRIVGAIESIRDIAERMAARSDLQKANRELEAFVRTVTHDLRSPLSAILGFSDLMLEGQGGQLDETGQEFLREIHTQGKRMQALMEDLLQLARVGQLERPAEPVDLNRVAAEVVRNLKGLLDETGTQLRIHELPSVRIPETLLCQILDNLIGNAARYAGGQGSPVEVGGERSGSRVRIHVRDQGPGIPEDARDRVFQVFYRGAGARAKGGTGVGLATVAKIAGLYGGRAWVEETPGGGSSFFVDMEDPA